MGRKIHTGRSRNDQVAVDLRLLGKERLLALRCEVADLAAALFAFARRHRAVPMVGRTHLQPAMPSSVGLWASAHGESLLDDLVVLGAADRALREFDPNLAIAERTLVGSIPVRSASRSMDGQHSPVRWSAWSMSTRSTRAPTAPIFATLGVLVIAW